MNSQRDNLNPIPEARLAMALWSHEYAAMPSRSTSPPPSSEGQMSKLTRAQRDLLERLASGGQLRRVDNLPWQFVADDDGSCAVHANTVSSLDHRGFLDRGWETVGRVQIRRINAAGRAALEDTRS